MISVLSAMCHETESVIFAEAGLATAAAFHTGCGDSRVEPRHIKNWFLKASQHMLPYRPAVHDAQVETLLASGGGTRTCLVWK